MSDFYEKMAQVAVRMIGQFGQRAVLRKEGDPTGPSHSPTHGEPWYFDIQAVDLEAQDLYQRGVLIGRTTRKLLVGVDGIPDLPGIGPVEPQEGDRVLIAPGDEGVVTAGGPFFGASHEISEVRRVAPGGTVVLYELMLRT